MSWNRLQGLLCEDPDQNGKSDTYGIAMQKNLFFWGFDLRGFFNGFGAYPSIGDNQSAWIKDDSGKLIPGLIQPEVKTALGKRSPGTRKEFWIRSLP